MKTLMIVMLCAAALIAAGSAQAFQLRNGTNHVICVTKGSVTGNCLMELTPHRVIPEESELSDVRVTYHVKGIKYASDEFSVRKGCHAEISEKMIKIFDDHKKLTGTVSIRMVASEKSK